MTDIAATAKAAAQTAIVGSAGKSIADTSRLDTAGNMHAAAQKFEAIFAGSMLKSMRSVHLAEDPLHSEAEDTFTDMQTTQLAQSMAQTMPMGIGKALEAFLGRAKSSVTTDQPSSSNSQAEGAKLTT